MPAVINLNGSATAYDLSISPFTGWQHGRVDASAVAHVASFARRSCHLKGWVDLSPYRDPTRTTFAVAHEVRMNPEFESRFIQVQDLCYAVCSVSHVGNSSCAFLTKVYLLPKSAHADGLGRNFHGHGLGLGGGAAAVAGEKEASADAAAGSDNTNITTTNASNSNTAAGSADADDGWVLEGPDGEHPSLKQLAERDYHEWMVIAADERRRRLVAALQREHAAAEAAKQQKAEEAALKNGNAYSSSSCYVPTPFDESRFDFSFLYPVELGMSTLTMVYISYTTRRSLPFTPPLRAALLSGTVADCPTAEAWRRRGNNSRLRIDYDLMRRGGDKLFSMLEHEALTFSASAFVGGAGVGAGSLEAANAGGGADEGGNNGQLGYQQLLLASPTLQAQHKAPSAAPFVSIAAAADGIPNMHAATAADVNSQEGTKNVVVPVTANSPSDDGSAAAPKVGGGGAAPLPSIVAIPISAGTVSASQHGPSLMAKAAALAREEAEALIRKQEEEDCRKQQPAFVSIGGSAPDHHSKPLSESDNSGGGVHIVPTAAATAGVDAAPVAMVGSIVVEAPVPPSPESVGILIRTLVSPLPLSPTSMPSLLGTSSSVGSGCGANATGTGAAAFPVISPTQPLVGDLVGHSPLPNDAASAAAAANAARLAGSVPPALRPMLSHHNHYHQSPPLIRRHMAIFTNRRALRPADFDFNLHMNMNMYISSVLDALKFAMRDFLDLQRKQSAVARARKEHQRALAAMAEAYSRSRNDNGGLLIDAPTSVGGSAGGDAAAHSVAARAAFSSSPTSAEDKAAREAVRGTPIVPLDFQFPVVAISDEDLQKAQRVRERAQRRAAKAKAKAAAAAAAEDGNGAAKKNDDKKTSDSDNTTDEDNDNATNACGTSPASLISVHHLGEVLGRLGYQSVVSKFTNKSHANRRRAEAVGAIDTALEQRTSQERAGANAAAGNGQNITTEEESGSPTTGGSHRQNQNQFVPSSNSGGGDGSDVQQHVDYMTRQTTDAGAFGGESASPPTAGGGAQSLTALLLASSPPTAGGNNSSTKTNDAGASSGGVKRDAYDMTRFASVEECVLTSRIEYIREVTELTSELEVTVMIPPPPPPPPAANATTANADDEDDAVVSFFHVDPDTLRVGPANGKEAVAMAARSRRGRSVNTKAGADAPAMIPIHYSVRCIPPPWVDDPAPYIASSGELILRPVDDLAVYMPSFAGSTIDK